MIVARPRRRRVVIGQLLAPSVARRSRWFLAVLLVIACGSTLAGCQSGAPDVDDSPAPTTSETDGASAESEQASAYAPSWSAVHADASNTDFSPVEPAVDVEERWSVRIDGSVDIGPLPWTINLGPTLDPDGVLYLTSTATGCHLRAIDGASGELRWCDTELDLLAVASSPLIDLDGHLYVADGQGMHALASDGGRLWDRPLRGVPLSAQFTPDGHLIFVTNTGTLYVLDRATGDALLDPVDLAPGASWSPEDGMFACARGTEACPSANTIAMDQQSGVLYFTFWAPGETHAGLRAMQYTGGPEASVAPLWSNEELPGGSASSPTISADGRRVYVTDNIDALHALDAATGEIVWSSTIGYAAGGSPSLSPDGLIIPSGGGSSPIIAIRDDGDEGTLAWRRDDLLNRGIVTQTAGGRAYATVGIGDNRCDLVVLDTRDGEELHRASLPGACVFSVGTTVGDDGTVYVPTIVGGLHAYR